MSTSSTPTLSSPEAIDLRSDTLTLPTSTMREVMAHAEVGDDVFGEDPSIQALQEYAASCMGMEAGLFVPSGTMGNQIAMLAHCQRGDEVIVGQGAHSFLYESGGGAVLAGVQFQVIGEGGYFTPSELSEAIHGHDYSGHVAPTRLMMIENTHNRGGGKVMDPDLFAHLAQIAHEREVSVHIDGARLWNAAVALDVSPSVWAKHADSVTFCLSKGLGAPVGSVLCGSKSWIAKAHRYRKMLGGGMRQAGILAAAGLYALKNHVEDLKDDHRRAKKLAVALSQCPGISIDPQSVETNIVIFTPTQSTPQNLCEEWLSFAKVLPFGRGQVRAVLHRNLSEDHLDYVIEQIQVYCQQHWS